MNRKCDSERLIENYCSSTILYRHYTGRRNELSEKNLPPGWVLQGESEQGMNSLSMLPANEVLATLSCGSNIYTNHMSPLFKNSTYETPTSDKHDVD